MDSGSHLRKISTITRKAYDKIRQSEKFNENNAILLGIKTGINEFELHNMKITFSSSPTWKFEESSINFNEIRITISLHKNNSTISIVWYCVSKNVGSFTKEDYQIIEKKLLDLENERTGVNLALLAVVPPNNYYDAEEMKLLISSVNDIVVINDELREDLIYLSCCVKDELMEFRKSFDHEIHRFLEDLLFHKLMILHSKLLKVT